MSKDSLFGAIQGQTRSLEAAQWFVRNDSDVELTPFELQEWDEWVSRPENSAEYDEVVRFHWRLRSASVPSLPNDADVLADVARGEEADWTTNLASPASPADQNVTRLGVAQRARISYPSAFSATLIACVVGALLALALYWMRHRADTLDEYATAPAEHREFRLEDGSHVTLAGGSALRLSYTAERRTVILERGEALFRVQHNAVRPFVVLAGRGSITAVGTEFDVKLNSQMVLVAVTEGSVEVAPQDPDFQKLAVDDALRNEVRAHSRLARGEAMTYDLHGESTAPQSTDPQSAAAWTRGSIEYRGRPLKEVVEDVQRYTTRRIQLDPAAAELQYSGIVIERYAEKWIDGLPKIFPLEIVSDSDRILVRLKTPAKDAPNTVH